MPNFFTIYPRLFSIPEISELLKGSFRKSFGTVRPKIFDGKTLYPLLCIKFFDIPNCLKHWRDAHEIFRHFGTKIFRQKNVTPLLFSHKTFRRQKFSQKHFLTKVFGTVRHKNFDKTVMPPSYAWNFSMEKNFWNTELFSNEIIWYSETKTFRRKIVIPPPLLSIKFFPYQNFSETQNGSLAKFFRSCEIKKFSTKPWNFPPPLLENFRYQSCFETRKWSPTIFIGTLREKFFNGVQWCSPLMHKIWQYTRFSETPKCSPTKFFGTVWQKFSTEKRDNPPLWCIKFFDTRNFLIHRSVPQRNFSALWDKKFWAKSRDNPSFA